MTRIKILLLVLCTQWNWAQTAIEGRIGEIKSSGWHQILISPEIRAASKPELGDFRIHDSKGNEIPYFLSGNNLPKNNDAFKDFEIISKGTEGKWTTFIVANPRQYLTDLSLAIANSAVTKNYRISGSDDQIKWFGLIDNDSLQSISDPAYTFIMKTIELPKTSYKYLKIVFDDTKTLPLNVLRIGNYLTGTKPKEVFVDIPNAKFQTQQANGKTIISIELDGLYTIDRIQFDIGQPKLYKRTAIVYYNEQIKRKRKTIQQQILLAEFELKSDHEKHIDLPTNKIASLFIEIENGDSSPLTISQIRLLQLPIYAVAEFQKQQTYTVSSGISQRGAPKYDLEYFSEQILSDVSTVKIVDIKKAKIAANSMIKPLWQRSWFLWSCISIAGLAILYFSISLIRDLNKN